MTTVGPFVGRWRGGVFSGIGSAPKFSIKVLTSVGKIVKTPGISKSRLCFPGNRYFGGKFLLPSVSVLFICSNAASDMKTLSSSSKGYYGYYANFSYRSFGFLLT